MIITLCRRVFRVLDYLNIIFFFEIDPFRLLHVALFSVPTQRTHLCKIAFATVFISFEKESRFVSLPYLFVRHQRILVASKWTVECVETSIMFSFNYRSFSSLSICEFVTLSDRQLTVDGPWRER